MHMRKAAIALLLVMLGFGVANAKPHGRFGNIVAMEGMGGLIAMKADLQVQAGTQADESDDLQTMSQYFSRGMVEARGHAALTGALKEYYAAMRAYLSNLDPQAGEAVIVYHARISGLETSVNNAKARLDVELQALGVSP